MTKVALQKLGLTTRLICLDKLYPEVVKDIESGPKEVLAYSDIGSGHVKWLSEWNKTGNLILTLDHHDTADVRDPLVHNLNPELDGFSGELDACSSTVAYLFAKTVEPSSTSFAPLAIIGSTEIPGQAEGLNTIPLKDAEAAGKVHPAGKGVKVDVGAVSVSPSRASTILNVLGSVGYYRHGPETGINACLNGLDNETMAQADQFEEERKTANQRILTVIRENGLSQLKNVQWFHAKDNYDGMSGKVVGSFCSYLTYQRIINPAKYLIGMMNVPPEIPGWGKLASPLVKVSGRAPRILAKLIEEGKRPALSTIMPEACEKVGGFGDGHSVAASGVFPVGSEDKFLKAIDSLAA
ncbi:DHH family phosphoesterase [Candidatus Bathyarchaeota archaeon]|nr:DHH family phosphoesterase [Candidatus Bathyarchaeota archaeon]